MKMRSEHGQAAALTVLFLTVLLLSAAAVLDVGAWFRADRDTQRIADAAALAGAQALPEDQSAAQQLALEYAVKNGGGLEAEDIEFSTTFVDGDTVKTTVEREEPTFFAKVMGLDSVTVGSTATARAGNPSEVKWVAPVVVNEKHENLVCACFGPAEVTRILLEDQHRPGSGDAAGAFALLNLEHGSDGAPGADSLSGWMMKGFDKMMKPETYRSAPSTLFNSSEMTEALTARTGTVVLFPVCKAVASGESCQIRRGGQNAEYQIIGWVPFHILDFENRGNSGWIEGYFDRAIWEGVLPATSPSTTPDFGVRTIALIN